MPIDEDTLTIFCPCWGQTHLDMLARYAIPSVLQPMNLPACGYKQLHLIGYSMGDASPLESVLRQGFSGLDANISVSVMSNLSDEIIVPLRVVVRSSMFYRRRMLLLMPDTVIANGGIGNMRNYCRNKPVSVAAPHLRVNTDSFVKEVDRTGGFPIEPAALVNLAMTHAHQSLTDSRSEKDNGTHMGGISLTSIGTQHTTVIHFLPTVFLAWFTESDAAFFDKAHDFGSWDHAWDRHLASEGRLRVFGSSELFFAVELTSPERNRIEVLPGSRTEEHSESGAMELKAFVACLHHA